MTYQKECAIVLTHILVDTSMKYSLFLVLLFSSCTWAQEQTFTVRVGRLTLGHVTTHRTPESIRLESRVKVPLALLTLRVGYVVNSQFLPTRQLRRSHVDAETNRGKFFTRTDEAPKGYRMTTEQHGKSIEEFISKPIHWTVTRLFYEEPIGIQEVYAEYYGTFMPVKPRREGEYVVEWGKNRDIYVYRKGQLVKIIKENPWKDFEIHRN